MVFIGKTNDHHGFYMFLCVWCDLIPFFWASSCFILFQSAWKCFKYIRSILFVSYCFLGFLIRDEPHMAPLCFLHWALTISWQGPCWLHSAALPEKSCACKTTAGPPASKKTESFTSTALKCSENDDRDSTNANSTSLTSKSNVAHFGFNRNLWGVAASNAQLSIRRTLLPGTRVTKPFSQSRPIFRFSDLASACIPPF